MKEVVSFLQENPVQILATTGVDGKPKARPFQFMMENDGRLFFCTSNQKPVYAEMSKNPHVELSAVSSSFAWIRLSGTAVFSDDPVIKEKIIESNDLVKSVYQSKDNPAFEVFYLGNASAVIADFSGNPPRSFTL